MSETATPTLSQPSTATSGLQPYDLRRPVRTLAPGVAAGTKRRRLRLIRRSWTAMQKGQAMSQFQLMIDTLKKSVVDIVTAAPGNQDELMTQTFTEFSDAFVPELEKAVGAGADEVLGKMAETNPAAFEEPLYKGLGTVGRVANLVSSIASSVKRIQEGKDWDSSTETADPASDEVMSLLEHALAAAELAMRAAVNEHVDPFNEGDEAEDGLHYVAVPNAEDPDNEDAAIVVKTALPEDLAKYASDPASISMAAVELGSGLLLEAGVSEEALGKMFAPAGDLAKTAPDGSADPAASADDGSEANPTDQTDPTDPVAALVKEIEILGRLAVAQLMQVDHLSQQLQAMTGVQVASPEDGADDGADGSGDGSAAPDETPPAAPAPEKFGKAAEDEIATLRSEMAELQGALAKRAEPPAEVAELRSMVGQLQGQLRKIAAEPAAPKALLVGATAMSKSADGIGPDPMEEVVAKLAAEYDAARTDDQRNMVLAKAAFKLPPGTDLSKLRKAA